MSSQFPERFVFQTEFANILCQTFDYDVCISDIIANTLYFGLSRDYKERINNELSLRTYRLKFLIQEFFANSYLGILQNMHDLLRFYMMFFDLKGNEKITYSWENGDQIDNLVHDYTELFQIDSDDFTEGLMKAGISRMVEDLRVRIDDYKQKFEGRKTRAVPDTCRKYFGSTFYENLLLLIRETVQPDLVPSPTKDKIIEAYYKGLPSKQYFHVLSLLPAELDPNQPMKYTAPEFKEVKEKYHKVEDRARRQEINLMMIYAGVNVDQFTRCLEIQGKNHLSPVEMVGSVFQKFETRLDQLDIFVEDVTHASFQIGRNVAGWLDDSFKAKRDEIVRVPPIVRDAPSKPEKSVSISPLLICLVIGIIIVLFFV